ncbi:PilN domain-containing protein [Afipia sp. GAS231]|uniref:PilN domain-containing protein n=1 Tax=Afipia sp. GAS231 TaxID=1882747 RepID=UPI001FCDEA4C|nr:PilN domain-containing protein [Afipia sp. GAS231]
MEGDANSFTARLTSGQKGTRLAEASFRLLHGQPEPALTPGWLAALRGSRIEVLMRPQQVLFREVDFPKQASDFLDGMIRAQIDLLTPWTAGDVVFGMTPAVPIANGRIALTLAATSQQKIQPLLELAADVAAASAAGLVEVPEAGSAPRQVKLFERSLTRAPGSAIDVTRLLRLMLVGASVAAPSSLAISAYVGNMLSAEQQELQHQIVQRRAALRVNQSGGSAEALLAKRKQTSPSSVMVLEAISRVLPDTTYVTELRVEGDKMQVVGLTQDAPSLIRLMEQLPQFTRATFFAPTTRAQSDPGDRFHIEAHITPYFGSGS